LIDRTWWVIPNCQRYQRTVNKWFNTDAFQPQALFTLGSAPANVLHGPPQRRIDCPCSRSSPSRQHAAAAPLRGATTSRTSRISRTRTVSSEARVRHHFKHGQLNAAADAVRREAAFLKDCYEQTCTC
jgi:hypothetical protein